MTRFRATFFYAFLAFFACSPLQAAHAEDAMKAVYHITDTENQAMLALNNARNHLRADPTAKIVLVANFKGINFLLDGAADKNGNPYRPAIEDLIAQGVEFRICKNTMDAFKVSADKVVPDVKIVPSGVAEVVRLQAREGYAYVKP